MATSATTTTAPRHSPTTCLNGIGDTPPTARDHFFCCSLRSAARAGLAPIAPARQPDRLEPPSPLEAVSQGRAARAGVVSTKGSLQMLQKPLRDDARHDFVGGRTCFRRSKCGATASAAARSQVGELEHAAEDTPGTGTKEEPTAQEKAPREELEHGASGGRRSGGLTPASKYCLQQLRPVRCGASHTPRLSLPAGRESRAVCAQLGGRS